MTAQLLGGTIGMAVASTLFSTTDSYRVVFLAAGALTVAVLIAAWTLIERHPQEMAEGVPAPEPAS